MHVPGYTLVDELSRSDTTTVFRARRDSDNRPVVLKILSAQRPTPDMFARVRREYAIARDLDLPGVVDMLDLADQGGTLMLVMADTGGVSLDHHIARFGRMPPATAVRIARDLAAILSEVHARNIVHKDVTPANVTYEPESGTTILIDFGLATRIGSEASTSQNPHAVSGTLAYLPPEQSGRINRSIDYRADYYGLGATVFHLLTGRLPFTETDPLTLLHQHMAVRPPDATTIVPEVPGPLAKIVDRLLAKTPEQRYQSGAALLRDLDACLEPLEAGRPVPAFEPGSRDIPLTLQIPQKLYGRTEQIERLIGDFERAASGERALTLVTGEAGVGKSALVNELYKPVTARGAIFVSGKFDQLHADQPYSALIEATEALVSQLLTESEARLSQWRERLGQALGSNGGVLARLVPGLTDILGPQPSPPELDPQSERNRFNRTIQDFVGALARAEQPLVVFVDDLQWGDSASLSVLETLLANDDLGYFHVVAAYRDTEVVGAHPVKHLRHALAGQAVAISDIALSPLGAADIADLLADTLNTAPAACGDLADRVYAKTLGNPFFITQLLHRWAEDGALYPDPDAGCWRWDEQGTSESTVTDNVVALMRQQLTALPESTQQLVSRAAVLGAQFDLAHLAVVAEQPAATVLDRLWPALEEGLIIPMDDRYKAVGEAGHDGHAHLRFLHDRVQQAAFERLPEDDRRRIQLTAGRLLVADIEDPGSDPRLFAALGHLNAARDLLDDDEECRALAQLSLTAARRAQRSAAYGPARDIARQGLAILGEGAWSRAYETTLGLHNLLAEAALMLGEHQQVDTCSDAILANARELADTAAIRELRVYARSIANDVAGALEEGLTHVRALGVAMPSRPSAVQILWEFRQTNRLLGTPRTDLALPDGEVDDPLLAGAMHIMTVMCPPAFFAGSRLFPILVLRNVQLVWRHGGHPTLPYILSTFGLLVTATGGSPAFAQRLSELAGLAAERPGREQHRAAIVTSTSFFIEVWSNDLKTTVAREREAYAIGLRDGNDMWAAYAASADLLLAGPAGEPLGEIIERGEIYVDAVKRMGQVLAEDQIRVALQCYENLLHSSLEPLTLTGSYADEDQTAERLAASNNRGLLFCQASAKLDLALHFDQPERVGRWLQTARANKDAFIASYTYMRGLAKDIALDAQRNLARPASTRWARAVPIGRRLRDLERRYAKIPRQRTVEPWVAYARAAYARLTGRPMAALARLDDAITAAQAEGQHDIAGLARRTAADVLLARNAARLAAPYVTAAIQDYGRFGAHGVVERLRTAYSDLLAADAALVAGEPDAGEGHRAGSRPARTSSGGGRSTSGDRTSSGEFDLEAILRSAQAIAEDIHPTRLTRTLMEVVGATAGATSGYLLLRGPDEADWRAHARLVTIGETRVESLDGADIADDGNGRPRVPLSLVRYVGRTCETVVLADVTADGRFGQDPYFLDHGGGSALCLPLVNQGRVRGMLYLENRLSPDAFRDERTRVLSMLSTQMAIAIENARLYENMQAEVAARTQELEAKSDQLERTNRTLMHSINYASLLQSALLPDTGAFARLAEHTELWWPRDVVGGDLYVARETADGLLLGVVDCTGHGVPGAFMTMAAYAAFDHAVEAHGGASPGAILESINVYMRQVLHRSRETGIDDGLEMALVRWSPGAPHLVFAGGGLDLFVVDPPDGVPSGANAGGEGSVSRIRGDRVKLGSRRTDTTRQLTEHTVDVPAGRALYMVSDGILDQVGGPKTITFGRRRLEGVLAAYAARPVAEQAEAIARAVRDWQGEEAQRDDMTMLGLRPLPLPAWPARAETPIVSTAAPGNP